MSAMGGKRTLPRLLPLWTEKVRAGGADMQQKITQLLLGSQHAMFLLPIVWLNIFYQVSYITGLSDTYSFGGLGISLTLAYLCSCIVSLVYSEAS